MYSTVCGKVSSVGANYAQYLPHQFRTGQLEPRLEAICGDLSAVHAGQDG